MFSLRVALRTLLMALLPTLLHGCGGPDGPLYKEPVTFILLDASTSVSGPTRAAYLNYLDNSVISKLQPGERVLLSPIGDSGTLTEPVRLVDLSLPALPTLPGGWNGNRSQQAHRCIEDFPHAVASFQATQSGMQHTFVQAFRKVELSKQTYLLDGFEMAARAITEFPGAHTLVVLSDGIEDSSEVPALKFDQPNFWRPGTTQRLLSALRAQGRIPQLSGAEVYFVGSPKTSPELARNIRTFWLSYLSTAGVSQAQIHFNARPRFRPNVLPANLDAKDYCHTLRP